MIFELSTGLATTTQRWLRVPRPLFQLSPYQVISVMRESPVS